MVLVYILVLFICLEGKNKLANFEIFYKRLQTFYNFFVNALRKFYKQRQNFLQFLA